MRAPEAYDAVGASGLEGPVEIQPMRPEQLMSLVLAYSAGPNVVPSAGQHIQLTDDDQRLMQEIEDA